MKTIILIVFLFITSTEIDKLCQQIDINLKNYKKIELYDIDVVTYKDTNFTMEGKDIYNVLIANLFRFFDNDTLVKINAEYFGVSEDLISEYYLANGKIIYLKQIKRIFKIPKINIEFDSTNFYNIVHEYYFKDDSIFKWKLNGESFSGFKPKQILIQEKNIIHDLNVYKRF
jgi:hypothetical protein